MSKHTTNYHGEFEGKLLLQGLWCKSEESKEKIVDYEETVDCQHLINFRFVFMPGKYPLQALVNTAVNLWVPWKASPVTDEDNGIRSFVWGNEKSHENNKLGWKQNLEPLEYETEILSP
jgi:hypothetical protein